jgi:hypothetical protein
VTDTDQEIPISKTEVQGNEVTGCTPQGLSQAALIASASSTAAAAAAAAPTTATAAAVATAEQEQQQQQQQLALPASIRPLPWVDFADRQKQLAIPYNPHLKAQQQQQQEQQWTSALPDTAIALPEQDLDEQGMPARESGSPFHSSMSRVS